MGHLKKSSTIQPKAIIQEIEIQKKESKKAESRIAESKRTQYPEKMNNAFSIESQKSTHFDSLGVQINVNFKTNKNMSLRTEMTKPCLLVMPKVPSLMKFHKNLIQTSYLSNIHNFPRAINIGRNSIQVIQGLSIIPNLPRPINLQKNLIQDKQTNRNNEILECLFFWSLLINISKFILSKFFNNYGDKNYSKRILNTIFLNKVKKYQKYSWILSKFSIFDCKFLSSSYFLNQKIYIPQIINICSFKTYPHINCYQKFKSIIEFLLPIPKKYTPKIENSVNNSRNIFQSDPHHFNLNKFYLLGYKVIRLLESKLILTASRSEKKMTPYNCTCKNNSTSIH